MVRPVRSALLILLAALLVLPTVLCVLGFALPAQYSETFLGILPDKFTRLREAQKQRIILVGGSSVPFGVKCALMEDSLCDYNVIDFGLYADIGTPVMLDLLEEELREGDIVVIMPEQNSQALSAYYNPESLWQAADGSFALLCNLSLSRFEKMLAAFPSFAGKKGMYALTGRPQSDDIYAKSSFDRYGDIASSMRSANIMAGGFNPNQPISFDADTISVEFLEILTDFYELATEKGAAVYYHFPPMNSAATDGSSIDEFYDCLRSVLPFSILGDPNRCVMDSGWFYDTNFHLNDSGATVFTAILIEDLKVLLHDTSPTNISLPAMPQPQGPAIVYGDDSCAHLFTYRQSEDGFVITGLTQEGKDATQLILPTTFDGLPVVGMDEGVLAGHKKLQKLTVQANISTLHDAMLTGCSALQVLYLTGAPSSYTVGDGLRTEDFMILVSEEYLDAYRRHYTWQQYSSYIFCSENP